jgi:hypothetical protein
MSVPKMEHMGDAAPSFQVSAPMRAYSGRLGSTARAISIAPTYSGKTRMLLCCCCRFFLRFLFCARRLPVFFVRFAGFLFRGLIDLLIDE